MNLGSLVVWVKRKRTHKFLMSIFHFAHTNTGMEGLSCSFAFNGTSFICCINSIYFANKPPPSAHSRSHQNKAFALWFSSFHKKSPFRDFKIWDGRTRTSECLDQNQVPYHLATSQYNYYSTL